MKTEVKEKVRGGEGNTTLLQIVNCENEKNIRLISEITLPPGASIGKHNHENEAEYYLILSGSGLVDDDGKEVKVEKGAAVITKDGAFHSIANNGTVPLVFHAVIVTY
jgi:mannose-6-phosphate isomerase-like protein (cupin superfamily)